MTPDTRTQECRDCGSYWFNGAFRCGGVTSCPDCGSFNTWFTGEIEVARDIIKLRRPDTTRNDKTVTTPSGEVHMAYCPTMKGGLTHACEDAEPPAGEIWRGSKPCKHGTQPPQRCTRGCGETTQDVGEGEKE